MQLFIYLYNDYVLNNLLEKYIIYKHLFINPIKKEFEKF